MTPKCEIVHYAVVKRQKSIPEKSTSHWAKTPVMPERQKEASFHLSSVSADFYDTGLVRIMIYDDESRNRVLQLTNSRALYKSGHLQKFLEVIQEITESFTINFAEFRNNTVEYNDHSRGEAFRAILDAQDLTSVKKFAAIMSYLITAPTLKAEHVLKIARLQENPIALEGKLYLGNLRYFILPHFNQASEMKKVGSRNFFNLEAANIEGVYKIIGFLRQDSDTLTFGEFSDSIGENYITEALGCDRETAETAASLYNEWGSTGLKRVTRSILNRLANLPMHNASSSLKDLVLERIISGETMTREIYDSLEYDLSSFLTVDEYEEFFEQLPQKQDFPKEMGALAIEVIVRYYLHSGAQKVKELLDVVKASTTYENNFFYTRTVYEMQIPIRQKLKLPHFMMLLNEEYQDMPLGWAVQLVGAEIEAEKQEKANKIQELMDSGVLPIAA